MKYRQIPVVADVRLLPDHINILRNLQDMHQAVVRLPETFPVLELGDIVPNFEGQLPDIIRKGKRILASFGLDTDSWDQDIKIDLSVYAMSAHELVIRKKALADRLEQLIVRWQECVDRIEPLSTSSIKMPFVI